LVEVETNVSNATRSILLVEDEALIRLTLAGEFEDAPSRSTRP
jgi:hypothetical protein